MKAQGAYTLLSHRDAPTFWIAFVSWRAGLEDWQPAVSH